MGKIKTNHATTEETIFAPILNENQVNDKNDKKNKKKIGRGMASRWRSEEECTDCRQS